MSNNSNFSWPLCKYKYIFGNANQGVHQYRLLGFSIFDIVLTIVGAFFISLLLKINFWVSLVTLFIVGEFLHIIFCVDTAFLSMFNYNNYS